MDKKNFININILIKMSKSVIVELFDFFSLNKLGSKLCIPSSISVLSCNDNDQITETITRSLTYIPSNNITLGTLTGIVIFGVVNYIIYKSLRYLTNDILNEETLNQVNTIENLESTQVISSVENIDGEDPISVILPTNNFTVMDTNSILNLIQKSYDYRTGYIPLGGQNGFNYIINTSHNLGFGKNFKYVIWSCKNRFRGVTDEEISVAFDLTGRNKLDINILNTFDKSTSLFMSDIMPLLQGDRWRTTPIPNVNYCRMVEHLQYLRHYTETYIDILVFGGNSSLKDIYLNSLVYFNVDAVNASIKLQEIFLELAKNGAVF